MARSKLRSLDFFWRCPNFMTLVYYVDFCLHHSGKKGSDDLFDKLDTSKLNAHLKELMPGLTAKVFRTYNASITLDDMVRCMHSMFYALCP